MPFGAYRSISDVAKAFRIPCTESEFVSSETVAVEPHFRAEMEFVLREVDFTNSEFSICENLVYPVLKEVWKSFTRTLMLWGHETLHYDDDLTGVPDYMVAKRSPLGKVVREGPFVFLVVEAKRDNFEEGWGQCFAAMVAAQRLNHAPELTVYGVVSNGRVWEFGYLQSTMFTRDTRLFMVQELDGLMAAVYFVFAECDRIAARMPRSA